MKTFSEIQKEIENTYKLINKKKEKLDQLIDTYSSIKDIKEKVKQHKAVEKDMCKLNEFERLLNDWSINNYTCIYITYCVSI